jgi:hypothetical protein
MENSKHMTDKSLRTKNLTHWIRKTTWVVELSFMKEEGGANWVTQI